MYSISQLHTVTAQLARVSVVVVLFFVSFVFLRIYQNDILMRIFKRQSIDRTVPGHFSVIQIIKSDKQKKMHSRALDRA